MNVRDFSTEEKQALLDLLLAGMYSDAHVASAENERIERLLKEFEASGDYERDLLLNEALTRARQRTGTQANNQEYVGQLAEAFSSPAHRQQACEALEELLGSDQQVTQSEQNFLNLVRTVFSA